MTTKKDFYLEITVDRDADFGAFNSSFNMRRYLWADRIDTLDIDDIRDTYKAMMKQSKEWTMITVSVLSCDNLTKRHLATDTSFRFVKRYEDVKYGMWDGYKYNFDGHQESFKDILKLIKDKAVACMNLANAQHLQAVNA